MHYVASDWLGELRMLAPQELPIFSQWRSQEGLNRDAGGKLAGICICMSGEAITLCICVIHEATSPSTLLSLHKALCDALRWLVMRLAVSLNESVGCSMMPDQA